MSNNELPKLVKWAESQGWECPKDSKGYTRFHTPEGDYVTDYPCTPSSQTRWRNLVAALKSAGLPWPKPSKSEQRSQRRKDQQNE